MDIKISVIVPAYNCEASLRRCLESIVQNDSDCFEVLLVDDGSTDSTPSICDEYANSDSRIKVFHKCNGGVSSARNLGLENARGEWIAFVDSDDEMAEGSIQHILNEISGQKADSPDMVVGNVRFFNNGQGGYTLYSSTLNSLDMLFNNECWGAVWNKFFSMRIINEHNIRFDEHCEEK